MPRDRWGELCQMVAEDDGLPTREVGPWSEDKLLFWHRYIDISTVAIHGHPAFPEGMFYVDLFAGPGVCKSVESGRRFPGSTLIAACAARPFRRIFACELQPELQSALELRLAASPAAGHCTVLCGDCNERVAEIAEQLPKSGALTLAFVDPVALHAGFDTIRALSHRGRVDFLILFADYMDVVRNVDLYERQSHSNLDYVLGSPEWRKTWAGITNRSPESICRFFVEQYKMQLGQKLGYRVFGEKVIEANGRPIYRLIYASKHDRGLEFWEKALKKNAHGQTAWDF